MRERFGEGSAVAAGHWPARRRPARAETPAILFTPGSLQPDFPSHLYFQRVHLSIVGLVIVAERVEDPVQDEIAHLGRQRMPLLHCLALRLIERDDDVAERMAILFGIAIAVVRGEGEHVGR